MRAVVGLILIGSFLGGCAQSPKSDRRLVEIPGREPAAQKTSLTCSKRNRDGERWTLLIQPVSGLSGSSHRILVSRFKPNSKPETQIDVSGLRCQIIEWRTKLSAVCVKTSNNVGSDWHSLFSRAHVVPQAVGQGFEFEYSLWHVTDDFDPETGVFDVKPHLELHEPVQRSNDWICDW